MKLSRVVVGAVAVGLLCGFQTPNRNSYELRFADKVLTDQEIEQMVEIMGKAYNLEIGPRPPSLPRDQFAKQNAEELKSLEVTDKDRQHAKCIIDNMSQQASMRKDKQEAKHEINDAYRVILSKQILGRWEWKKAQQEEIAHDPLMSNRLMRLPEQVENQCTRFRH